MLKLETAERLVSEFERAHPGVRVEKCKVGLYWLLYVYPNRADMLERYSVFSEPSLEQLGAVIGARNAAGDCRVDNP